MTEHTPTPWSAKQGRPYGAGPGRWHVGGDRWVAELDDEANARHIVKCVNAHDGLEAEMARLRGALDGIADQADEDGEIPTSGAADGWSAESAHADGEQHGRFQCAEMARAALSQQPPEGVAASDDATE